MEWDHERYFRSQCERHLLWRVFPRWGVPPPRESIRQVYGAFRDSDQRMLEPVRVPLLAR